MHSRLKYRFTILSSYLLGGGGMKNSTFPKTIFCMFYLVSVCVHLYLLNKIIREEVVAREKE